MCFSSIDWDFNWQGHQEVASRQAADGHPVLFVETTGARSPRSRDLPRIRARLRNWRRGSGGLRSLRAGLTLFSPLVLPFPYSRWAQAVNRRLLLGPIHRWLRLAGGGRPIVWNFLPTPLAVEATRALAPELSIYYCVDDIARSSLAARPIARSEAQAFRSADLVFVTTDALRSRALRFRETAHVLPFGVDLPLLEAARAGPVDLPAELRGLPLPLVGYLGGINRKMDQALVAGLAARLPKASVVLLGPIEDDVSKLRRMSNVHLLGARPHSEVPRYLRAFTVGIIPYRLDDYTAHVRPVKLNEYLAMGLPVVSTGLPEIRRVDADHAGIVRIAADADTFADAVRVAAHDSSPETVARRVDVARQHDWDTRFRDMRRLVDAELDRRRRPDQHPG